MVAEPEKQAGTLYAETMLTKKAQGKSMLDNWCYPMEWRQPLPSIPVWLNEERSDMLDLEPGYEEVCRVLRITP